MPTIVIDYENNAEDFWDAVHSSDPKDPAAHFLMNMADEEEVDRDLLEKVIAFASKLPGWDDGPDHAKHPITWSKK